MSITQAEMLDDATQVVIGSHTNDIFVVNSSNVANSGFKYILDVYINGKTFFGQSYMRFFIPPEPATGKAFVDVSRIVRDVINLKTNYYNKYLQTLTDNIWLNDDGVGTYVTLKIGEAYFTTPTTYSLYPNLGTFNARVYPFYYYVTSPVNSLSMQKYDDRSLIDCYQGILPIQTIGNQKYFNTPYNIWWFYYNFSSAEISAGKSGIILSLKDAALNNWDFVTGTPYHLLNSVSSTSQSAAATLSAGVYSGMSLWGFIDSNNICNMQIYHNKDGNFSSPATIILYPGGDDVVNVVNICEKDYIDGMILYWLNEYGNINHYFFPLYKRTHNVKRDFILNKIRTKSNDSVINQFASEYYSAVDMNTQVISYNTTDDDDALLLRSLINSKFVFMNDYYNQNLRRVLITDANYKVQQYRTDKVMQFTFNIQEAKTQTV